ncbi:MAG TPA: hypothetical protein HA362_05880 [Nanoarchaeota archaeon]|nr:hypothetical protein [Nanoarchaeota archaeon]
MTRLSEKTENHLKDEIVSALYHSKRSMFSNQIATEICRDNELVKRLLAELDKMGVVERLLKNKRGVSYKERNRWRLRPEVEKAFRQSSF